MKRAILLTDLFLKPLDITKCGRLEEPSLLYRMVRESKLQPKNQPSLIVSGPAEKNSWRRQMAMAEKMAKQRKPLTSKQVRQAASDLARAYDKERSD